MRRDKDPNQISPGLPILDELGDALHREFAGQERTRRRRHLAAGVILSAIVAVSAMTLAMLTGGTQQARAVEIATGRTANASWRLVLVRAGSASCLRLAPRDAPASGGVCAAPNRFNGAVARTRISGQAFVYGFSDAAAPAVRLSATGEIQHLSTSDLLPSNRDPSRRGGRFVRQISTKPLPPVVTAMRVVPAGSRVFVAAIPDGRDDTVIVESRDPGDNSVVIRVSTATSR